VKEIIDCMKHRGWTKQDNAIIDPNALRFSAWESTVRQHALGGGGIDTVDRHGPRKLVITRALDRGIATLPLNLAGDR